MADEIPADIMKAAEKAFKYGFGLRYAVAIEAIAKAILAERHRCAEGAATLCDAVAHRPIEAPESGAWERAERHTAKRLAAEIRALVTSTAKGSEHG